MLRSRRSTYKTAKNGIGIRWYARDGRRQFKSGFRTQTEARAWWDEAIRPELEGRATAPEPLTLTEFSEKYLTRYEAIRSPASVQTLRWRLVRPLEEFGDTELTQLRAGEIAAWEAGLPPRFRHAVMRAFRQVCKAAVEWGYLTTNPAKTGASPAPIVLEKEILTPGEVDALAEEMEPLYGAAVIVGAWCYLRPSELLSLERRDLDLTADLLHVRGTKTQRSRRSVPVPTRALQALEELPPRIDTRLLFPGPSGALYDLRNFRRREFTWAVEAAGLPASTTPYTLRHSGISWALSAGIPASDVARYGGTSVTMLERVYHHLLVSSAETARVRMDEFLAASERARVDDAGFSSEGVFRR